MSPAGIRLIGTANNDILQGAEFDDYISGLGGEDTLTGNAGNDTILGGTGNDLMYGNSGNDSMDGGTGTDYLEGGNDDDTLFGGNDSVIDTLIGGDGDDTYTIQDFQDEIIDDTGSNTLKLSSIFSGTNISLADFDATFSKIDASAMKKAMTLTGNANDSTTILGGTSNDTINGGSVDDFLYGNAGNDNIYGNDGNDYASGGVGNDNIYGNDGDDTILGDAGNDFLQGGLGDDSIEGGVGNDTLYGNEGTNILNGGAGNDTYLFDGSEDPLSTIIDSAGIDTVRLLATAGEFPQDAFSIDETGVDNLTAAAVTDTDLELTGNILNNSITGGSGDDTIDGVGGKDVMTGGYGDDIYHVRNVGDRVIEALNAGDDTVILENNYTATAFTLANNVETLIMSDFETTKATTVKGNASDNEIYASDSSGNLIKTYALGGNDTFNGGAVNDYVDGGVGNDTLYGRGGNDTLLGNAGNDYLYGAEGSNTMNGGAGNDTYGIDGFETATTIIDASGIDTLELVATEGAFDPAEASLLSYTMIENLDASAITDTELELTGNNLNNVITGGALDDVISSGLGNDTVYGGDGADSINGGAGNDTLYGQAGNDRIFGGTGSNTLDGGLGNDTFLIDGTETATAIADSGGTDTVELVATAGAFTPGAFSLANYASVDNLDGSDVLTTNLTLTGNDLANVITGGDANDSITGGLGNDSLIGGAGDDVIFGNAGDDNIQGNAGTNTLYGGAGDDTYLLSGDENTTIQELADEGTDTVQLVADSEGGFAALGYTLGSNLENLDASDITDTDLTLSGNTLDNIIAGGSGNDGIIGGAGDDVIYGNDGNDFLQGNSGTNSVYGGLGDDTFLISADETTTVIEYEDEGNDTVQLVSDEGAFTLGGYTLESNVENLDASNITDTDLSLVGNELNNTIEGGAGADSIVGGLGDDILYGNDSNDVLQGDTGTNSLYGGLGDDTFLISADETTAVIEYEDEGVDTVQLVSDEGTFTLGGYTLGSNVENLDATSITDTDLSLVGNELDNIIEGGAGADSIIGGLGDDILFGNDGDDVLQGDAGTNELHGGLGNDTFLISGDEATTIYESTGEGVDTVELVADGEGGFTPEGYTLENFVENLDASGISTTDLSLLGNSLDNIIDGGAGSDSIIGGIGDDDLYGNAGNDNLIGGVGTNDLYGGLGDDTYQVGGEETTTINEITGEGVDTVKLLADEEGGFTPGGYALENFVDNLDASLIESSDLELLGNELSNTIQGGDGSDEIIGAAGNDLLYGNDGDDIIAGGTGTNNLYGGLGNDTYQIGGDETTTVHEFENEGTDTVELIADIGGEFVPVAYALGDFVDNLDASDITGTSLGLTGNSLDNVITGGSLNDTIIGDSGDDSLIGGAGNDALHGDEGDDVIQGNTGTNDLYGGLGNDTFLISGDETTTIHESTGEGTDNVELVADGGGGFTPATYSLENFVDNLDASAITTTSLSLTGNELANVIEGGALNDSIIGGDGNDTLYGNAGNDIIEGNAGTNQLYGGLGDDTFLISGAETTTIHESTGEGTDTVELVADGGGGFVPAGYILENFIENLDASDVETTDLELVGNELNNVITGGDFSDTISGDSGNDTLIGGLGDDTVLGGIGNDNLYGDDGNDVLQGDSGINNLYGGDGNDTFLISADETTTIHESIGEGTDTVELVADAEGGFELGGYTLNDFVDNLDASDISTSNLELTGNDLNNTITGGDYSDSIIGGDGNDELIGGIGEDYLMGGAGNDDLYGDADNDVLQGDSGTNNLYGGVGDDTFLISDNETTTIHESTGEGTDTVELLANGTGGFVGGTYGLENFVDNLDATAITTTNLTLTGNELANVIEGGALNDSIIGGDGNDTLYGNAGNDIIEGNAGTNQLYGGLGNDTFLISGAETTTIHESTGEGTDTVQLVADGGGGFVPASYTLESFVDNLDASDITATALTLNGNALANTITGGSLADVINSGAGDDSILGGSGDDIIFGGDGEDIIEGGDGNDNLYGDADNDALFGGLGSNNLEGGLGNDTYLIDGNETATTIVNAGGIDTVQLVDTAGTFVDPGFSLAAYTDVNNLDGSDITLSTLALEGNALANTITGGSLADSIDGADGADVLHGGSGNDSINGGDGDDNLYGEADNDTLFGGLGTNNLEGGLGNDTYLIDGNEIATTIVNEGGTDTIELVDTAGAFVGTGFSLAGYTDVSNLNATAIFSTDLTLVGNDLDNTISGGDSNDIISGGIGNDNLYGNDGNDTIYGNTGNDNIYGNDGNDKLQGHSGTNLLAGGLGDDTYRIGGNADETTTISEASGEGSDTVSLVADAGGFLAGSYSLDTVENQYIDKLDASEITATALTLTGNDMANLITGGAMSDYITGGNGADTIYGGLGADTIIGEAGDDVLYGEDGDDILYGGLGSNTFNGGLGNNTFLIDGTETATTIVDGGGSDTVKLVTEDGTFPISGFSIAGYASVSNLDASDIVTTDLTLTGNALSNTITGGDANDTIVGNDGNDVLLGGLGDDSISGGVGNDVLYGSGGTNILDGGLGVNTYLIDGTETATTINDGGSDATIKLVATAGAFAPETFTLEDYAAINNLDASDITATNLNLTGNDLDNIIEGGALNDTINGGVGADTITTGAGNNRALGGAGNDFITGGIGSDYIDGGDDNDSLYGGDGKDTLYGSAGNDYLEGGANNDYLCGGVGDDSLYGNDGNDYVYGNEGNNYLSGDAGNDYMVGGSGNDTMYGGDGADNIISTAGTDKYYGGAGNDTITGSTNASTYTGGTGNDMLYAGGGIDTFLFNEGDNIDTISEAMSDLLSIDTLTGIETGDILFYTDLDGNLYADYTDGGIASDVVKIGLYDDNTTIQVGDYSIDVNTLISEIAGYTDLDATAISNLSYADKGVEALSLTWTAA